MKFTIRLTMVLTMLILVSCTKDYVVQPAPPSSVSFSNDVIPVFNDNCVSCHGNGGVNPVLTPDKAYQSLLSDPDLVKPVNPEASELYMRISGQMGSMMPPEGRMPENKIHIIYQWIKDGAQNN